MSIEEYTNISPFRTDSQTKETRISEERKWSLINSNFNRLRGEHPYEYTRLFQREEYQMAAHPDQERDYDTNQLSHFTQKDGTVVDVEYEHTDHAHVLKDVIFTPLGGEPVHLKDYIPEGYTLVEGTFPYGVAFVLPEVKVIGLSSRAMETVGGRFEAIHEIGHAINYAKQPRSRSEVVQAIQGLAHETREKAGWEEANKLLDVFTAVGVNFLPEEFMKNEYQTAVHNAIAAHEYELSVAA